MCPGGHEEDTRPADQDGRRAPVFPAGIGPDGPPTSDVPQWPTKRFEHMLLEECFSSTINERSQSP
jgi:hypothetical protein